MLFSFDVFNVYIDFKFYFDSVLFGVWCDIENNRILG